MGKILLTGVAGGGNRGDEGTGVFANAVAGRAVSTAINGTGS